MPGSADIRIIPPFIARLSAALDAPLENGGGTAAETKNVGIILVFEIRWMETRKWWYETLFIVKKIEVKYLLIRKLRV